MVDLDKALARLRFEMAADNSLICINPINSVEIDATVAQMLQSAGECCEAPEEPEASEETSGEAQ